MQTGPGLKTCVIPANLPENEPGCPSCSSKAISNPTRARASFAVYGGKSYLGVRREVREAGGVAAGEQLAVRLEYDAELRTVDLPDALRAELQADAGAAAAFEKLSHTRKEEFVQWVTGAKRPQTQRRRMEQAMAMLHRGSARR